MDVNKTSFGFPQSEIIRYHGYPSEEYQVTTEDGYILGVFRIPAGRNRKKPAVLLHHGTLGDSIHWISNLPNNSLGFILADAGYDVWLGNSRGDTWSLKHKTLKPCQKEFWQFSFDEIGKYDIPAELYFIMNKTGQKDVYYVGHSEASTAGFIAFSTYPELAQRVKVFFALGPAATITYATSPLVTLTRKKVLCFSSPQLLLGCKGILHQNELLKRPLTWICRSLAKVCGSIFSYIAGDRIQNLNMSRIDTYVGHFPAGTSVQNAIHWHQENMKKYNQVRQCSFLRTHPWVLIGTPIAVWSGGQDKFADPKDMAKLLPRIPNLIYHEHFPAWGHLGFIWGLDEYFRDHLF
uniref:Partial AB-hydrolase lipase domain-containing protein n=1 Tax=Bubo bubo TaxID=30461 RepID=A0A8C0IHY2_BUBBB